MHDRSRLPEQFDHLPNEHEASHHFLGNDSATAVNASALPPVNAWGAARYTLARHHRARIREMRRGQTGGCRPQVLTQ